MSERPKMRFKKEVAIRYNYRCYLCGKENPLSKASVDHLVPLSVAKWTDTSMHDLNNLENLAYSCEHCNSKKNADILSLENYLSLNIVEKDKFEEFYHGIEHLIKEHEVLIADVSNSQNGKCVCCGRKLKHFSRNLRRTDWDEPRSRENASVVCGSKCNKALDRVILQRKKNEKKKV